MKEPFFTIIVPVYNVKRYIETTLNTIRQQTYKNYEVICVDDGSSDGSGVILDHYASMDNRFQIIHKQNGGVSSARNIALDLAKGDWVVFVDGDDGIRYDTLEILNKEICKYPNLDIVGYGSKRVNSIEEKDLKEHSKTYIAKYEDCRDEIVFNAMNHYTVWSAVFRRDLIGNTRFFGLKNGEDQLFYNTIVMKVEYYLNINVPFYLYLQREGSAISNEWSFERQENYVIMLTKMLRNMILAQRKISPIWIKRWIGSLLINNEYIWNFPKKERKMYLNKQRELIHQSLLLKGIPIVYRLWIAISCKIKSTTLFKFVTYIPMKFYSKIMIYIK